MQIRIGTESNIDSDAELVQQISAAIRNNPDRLSEQVTRVGGHLSDQNSDKRSGTRNLPCLLEARLESLQPTSLSDSAATLEQAVDGEVETSTRSLNSTLGRIGKR